ncbi:MAG: hypothetical protein ACD_72C00552G0003 [uncultured bacterium]|nr:MAG: hypothetical protein ACD_72C00552G0003 [uncultured bacterium]
MIKIQCNFGVAVPLVAKDIQKIAQAIAKKEKKIKGEIELSFIGDKEMTTLNYHYRGKKYPTDVLSFAWQEESGFKSSLLGQIYICYPQIKRQAKEWKVTVEAELARMLIHGLLHLVGHDHIKKTEAKKMFTLQEGAVKDLGYDSQKFV